MKQIFILLLLVSLFSTHAKTEQEKAQEGAAKCPFTLGSLCFYPAVGVMYGDKNDSAKYKDIRFAAVIHGNIGKPDASGKRRMHSFGAMVTPGENFIDAAGAGGAYGFIEVSDGKFAVLNYGVMAKRHKGEMDEIKAGFYLMLSYSF